MDEFNCSESTASTAVYKISAQFNKTQDELLKDAKNFIVDQLLAVIDESVDKEDLKSRLAAIKQLSDVTKLTEEKPTEVKLTFDFNK